MPIEYTGVESIFNKKTDLHIHKSASSFKEFFDKLSGEFKHYSPNDKNDKV